MDAKRRLMAEIEAALARAAAGDRAGAVAHLDRLGAEAGRGGVLGPETALGLPRKLHAAHLRIAKRSGDAAARIGLQALNVPAAGALAGLLAPDPAVRAAQAAAQARPVPRLIHQIWIGGPPPAACAAWAAHAARHGWTYRLWGEAELEALDLGADPLWRAMRAAGDLPGAVDVARYHVIGRDGGLYLDCDWMPARPDLPPDAVLPPAGLSVLAEAAPRQVAGGSLLLSNALIAAPAGHPLFPRLIAALPEMARRLPDGPAWWVTGPLAFTLAARQGPVCVLDAGVMEGALPRGAPLRQVEAMQARAQGFLIAWKGW